VYDHSNAAHNLLTTLRVSVVRGGGEVEILRRAMAPKARAVPLAGGE
jgi:stearoyl-CoA desaturase (delta-9 desaturase)